MSPTDRGAGKRGRGLRRPHRQKREEPLVPIKGARVRAAITWKGLSVNAAAKQIKVSQQTLDSIVRQKTLRCYQSLRDRLATLLGLPAGWLGGESATLPSLTPFSPPPDLGYTPPLWVDENLMVRRPGEEGTLPPRYQLAAHDLWRQVAAAWRRDIDRGNTHATEALARLGTGSWNGRPWDRAQLLVTRWVSAFWWRRLFLLRLPSPAPVDPERFSDAEWRALGEGMMLQNQRRLAEEHAAADELAAHATTALCVVLRPWFQGERDLAYDRFLAALEWAARGEAV